MAAGAASFDTNSAYLAAETFLAVTISSFFSYVKDETPNPYTWLELKSVSLAGIYAQKYLNSGKQHGIFE